MTFEELHKIKELADEYLQTRDDYAKDEWYATDRWISAWGVEGFIDWLGEKIGEEI